MADYPIEIIDIIMVLGQCNNNYRIGNCSAYRLALKKKDFFLLGRISLKL